jgi:hypothetical protein
LLNFTAAERAWLRVAYHLGSDGSGPTEVVDGRDDALRKLAVFLNVEFAELVACTFPNRLCALQLLEPVAQTGFEAGNRTLGEWLRGTQHLR